MSETVPETRKIHYIQILRAFAALLVALAHMSHELVDRQAYDPLGIIHWMVTGGQFGVDIFFVISGFIMYHVVVGRPLGPAAAIAFMKKRIVRVVPLYWLYSLLLLAPIILAPAVMNRTGYSAAYLIASFLFIPWARPGTGDLSPLLAVGWTLNFEMFFYLFFAILIALRVRNIVLTLFIAFGGLALAGFWVDQDQVQLWYWTRTMLLEFVFGALIAAGFRRNLALPIGVGIAALLAGLAIWHGASLLGPVNDRSLNIRGLTWGLAAALIVGAISLTPRLASATESRGMRRLFHGIGDASYSLYLCHMFVVRICTLALGGIAQAGGWGVLVYFSVGIAGCIAAARLSYRFVEVPLIRFGRRDPRTSPAPSNDGRVSA